MTTLLYVCGAMVLGFLLVVVLIYASSKQWPAKRDSNDIWR